MARKFALNSEILDWLLDFHNPSVRYWALIDIQDMNSSNIEVIDAHEAIMSSPEVIALLRSQEPEGHWVHRDNMYLPKYKATTHQLLILAELGVMKTAMIDKAVNHVFEFQRTSGHFLMNLPKSKKGKASKVRDGCCFDGNILFYLNHFGYLDDPRTQKLIDFIITYHDDENAGWKCRAFPINKSAVFPKNCFMGAIKVLKAFSYIPEKKRSLDIKRIIKQEIEKILKYNIFQYLRNSNGLPKGKAGWKRFGFPLFYQSDLLEVLDTLTRLGINDNRMKPALEIVLKTRQKDGRWQLKNTYNGKMWVDFEEKNKPSKWITLRALRVFKRLYF